MPFVPLTPEEKKSFAPPCSSDQHDPPAMLVIIRPMKWRCPVCGKEVMLFPNAHPLLTHP